MLVVFERLFDDAGLYPPARRPMAAALVAHERARTGLHGHLVGRFVCPVARLDELEACVAAGVPRPPELSLVAYRDEVRWPRAVSRPEVVQVEVPLGEPVPEEVLRVRRYVELPPRGDVREAIDRVARTGARVKVRCGGMTPDAVPSPRRLAEILATCATRRVPLKATAGLHQPFRHRVSPGGWDQHGLLNVLAAASAAVAGASVDHLTQILEAGEDARDEVLGRVDRPARALLISVGTCSIDEPVAALHELGLLAGEPATPGVARSPGVTRRAGRWVRPRTVGGA
jgi:hypothetical protein